jgi:hypothetical protein
MVVLGFQGFTVARQVLYSLSHVSRPINWLIIIIIIIIIILQYWGLNSGLCDGGSGALPLEPCLQPSF